MTNKKVLTTPGYPKPITAINRKAMDRKLLSKEKHEIAYVRSHVANESRAEGIVTKDLAELKMEPDLCDVCTQITNHGCLKCCSKKIRKETLRHVLEIVEDVSKRSINNHEWAFNEIKKELTALADSPQDVGLTTVSSKGALGGDAVQPGNSADSKPVDARKGCGKTMYTEVSKHTRSWVCGKDAYCSDCSGAKV